MAWKGFSFKPKTLRDLRKLVYPDYYAYFAKSKFSDLFVGPEQVTFVRTSAKGDHFVQLVTSNGAVWLVLDENNQASPVGSKAEAKFAAEYIAKHPEAEYATAPAVPPVGGNSHRTKAFAREHK